jgi:hypothetical protein
MQYKFHQGAEQLGVPLVRPVISVLRPLRLLRSRGMAQKQVLLQVTGILRLYRSISYCFIVTFLVLSAASPAIARTYPPTISGLRQLVADDAAMLPAPYAAELYKEEKDWENGIGVTCTTYNQPLGRMCSPDSGDMIKAIQDHVTRSNDYLFYSDHWFTTFPIAPADQVDLSVIAPVVLTQDIPQIVSPRTTQALAFNAAVREFALRQWDAQGGPPRTDPHQDKSEDLALDYTIAPNPLPGVVSVSFSLGWDTKTGVHGNFSIADFNWNLPAGRELGASDIFAQGKPWQSMLDAQADAIFAKISGEPFPPDSYDFSPPTAGTGIHQGEKDPHEWRVTAAGLTIDTREGEVCGYDCGLPNAFISWTALRPYLNSNGIVRDP